MTSSKKGLLAIHSAVLLFGISGLFGKWLTLSPLTIVLGRVFFSSIFLIILISRRKLSLRLSQYRDYSYLIIMGIILAVHWISFFASIQLATVTIGLLTFSTFPIFVTLLEPYCFKEKLHIRDLLATFLTFVGVILVVPGRNMDSSMFQGFMCGIVSGLTYAILSLLNRKYVNHYPSLIVAFYEQSTACILLLPIVLLTPTTLTPRDIALLVILGVVFTGVSHTLFITGLKYVRVQTAGIISALEPVYGIILAACFLGELPTLREILGGLIILVTITYSSRS